MASPSPILGVRNPTPKLQSLLSQERLKLRAANLADAFTGSIRAQAHEKVRRKVSVGVSRDFPNFLSTPLLSQESVKLRTSNLACIFTASIRKKPLKNLGEKGAWAYQGTAGIFSVPPIISGRGKATNFQFCMHILSIDRNKSPLQISGKVAVCQSGLSKFFRAPLYWAHRAVVFAIAQLS